MLANLEHGIDRSLCLKRHDLTGESGGGPVRYVLGTGDTGARLLWNAWGKEIVQRMCTRGLDLYYLDVDQKFVPSDLKGIDFLVNLFYPFMNLHVLKQASRTFYVYLTMFLQSLSFECVPSVCSRLDVWRSQ